MAEPTNLQDYLARFAENQKIEGFGLDTAMRVPCPFCAAPDFMRYAILDVRAAMEKGATCGECGRSAKAVFESEPGITQFEIVQSDGPDQPEWLQPKMRRLS